MRYMLELRVNIKLDDVVFVGWARDAIRAHPAQSEPDAAGKGQAAAYGVTFEIGSTEAEVRVVKSIYDRVGLDITITGRDGPIPSLFERGFSQSKIDLPAAVASDKRSQHSGRRLWPAVVDRLARDPVLVERDVLNKLSRNTKENGFEAVVIDATGDSELAKRRGQAEILELVDCSEIIRDIGSNVTNREVSVSLLCKGGPAVVGIPSIRGR